MADVPEKNFFSEKKKTIIGLFFRYKWSLPKTQCFSEFDV